MLYRRVHSDNRRVTHGQLGGIGVLLVASYFKSNYS